MPSMTQFDLEHENQLKAQWLHDRLTRQERGIAILRDALQDEASRREHDVRERDRVIHDLQGHVAERDHYISDLQRQLGEWERRIRELETELHRKVLEVQIGERDRRIQEMQVEIQALRSSAEVQQTVSDRDQIIRDLHQQLADRDVRIQALESEIQGIHLSKVWPLLRLSGLVREILSQVGFIARTRST